MNIQNILKNHLQFSSKEKIAYQLGYNTTKKGIQALESFLEAQDLHSWLYSGYYDFRYTAEEFFIKICAILDVPFDEVTKEILVQKKKHDSLQQLKNNYIFVNTHFKRTTEPIFVLAVLEPIRRLKVQTDNLHSIAVFVKNHYFENNGQLKIWGKIDSYIFHKGDDIYTFDVYGKIIENEEVLETKAILKLKGKKLY